MRLALVLVGVVAIGCSKPASTDAKQATAPPSKDDQAYLMKQLDIAFEGIDKSGSGDARAWRTITYVLSHEDASFRHMAVPTMLRLIELRPQYRQPAASLVEALAIRAPLSDVTGKWLYLTEFAQLLGVARFGKEYYSPELGDVEQHDSRVEKLGRIDESAKSYVLTVLEKGKVNSRVDAMRLVIRGASFGGADLQWALEVSGKFEAKMSGDERRFWQVGRQSITGKFEALK